MLLLADDTVTGGLISLAGAWAGSEPDEMILKAQFATNKDIAFNYLVSNNIMSRSDAGNASDIIAEESVKTGGGGDWTDKIGAWIFPQGGAILQKIFPLCLTWDAATALWNTYIKGADTGDELNFQTNPAKTYKIIDTISQELQINKDTCYMFYQHLVTSAVQNGNTSYVLPYTYKKLGGGNNNPFGGIEEIIILTIIGLFFVDKILEKI